MLIHLKRHEKLYLNGAVIRLDRRGTIELLNDANFLLENHIMQSEAANTPLKQIYFLVQLMLMDPHNAHLMMELFKVNMLQIRLMATEKNYIASIEAFEAKVLIGEYFEAMKQIRQLFTIEQEILSARGNVNNKKRDAA